MVSIESLRENLESLRGLAEANLADLQDDPSRLEDYESAIRAGRFAYVRNRDACGRPACWAGWRSLLDRYKGALDRGERVPADCKQLAGAHAAFLVATTCWPVWVGIVPPRISIAHAVVGVEDQGNGQIRLMDPSVVAGMAPLHSYAGVYWMQVRGRRC